MDLAKPHKESEKNVMDLSKLHKQMLYSQVRVRTAKAGGSGTIIYSAPADGGSYHTYALRNARCG